MPQNNTVPDRDSEEEAAIEAHVQQIMETDRSSQSPADKPKPATMPGRPTPPPPMDIFEGHEAPGDIALEPPAEQPADNLDDPELDQTVDKITRDESDKLLKADEPAVVMKPKFIERLKNGLASWWGNPRKRYGTLAGIVVVLLALGLTPVTRYFVFNGVGLRAHASITITDDTTDLPLKNVSVTLAGKTAETNAQGKAELSGVKLGKQTLTVHKTAFADYKKVVTVGLGGVQLPSIGLKAVGSQFTFTLTDYLSGKPVAKAEVASGEATALSDKTGQSILTIQPKDGQKLSIQVTAKGYRTEKIQLDPTVTKPTAVALVPAGKEVFVSKASGRYDLYSVDLDGKNRKLLLPGTGNENQNIALSVNPDNTEVALVSTRDNQHDSDGYLLSTLTVLKVDGSAALTLDHSEQISLLGWAGNKLVYTETVAGASAANPNRQRITAYDYAAGKRVQLASANYFNVAQLIGGNVYYAVSSTGTSSPNFSRVSADGSGRQTLLSQEVWSAFRTSYSTISLQSPAGWFSYSLGTAAAKAGSAPDSYVTRVFTDSSDGSHSLWADTRDGKGVLLNHDIATGKDTTVTTQAGLTGPLRWLNDDTAIYRVATGQETADYAVSLQGGQPKKITDVTNTY